MILVYSVFLDLDKGAKDLFRDAAYFESVTGDIQDFERIDSPDHLTPSVGVKVFEVPCT